MVQEMTESEAKMNFIRSIVFACHQFGKTVCMEGVEQAEQNEIILNTGCDMIQGYYYFRPMELRDLYRLVSQKMCIRDRAWTAGMIAHSGKAHGERKGKNILAAVCGAGTYVFLYGCKTVVMQRFVMGAVWQAVWPVVISKCSVSLFNAVLASVCSVALMELLRLSLIHI